MDFNLLFFFLLYILLMRALVRFQPRGKDFIAAVLGLGFFALCFYDFKSSFPALVIPSIFFLILSFLFLRKRRPLFFWLSLLTPLLWLVAAKSFGWGALFGISYMAFRVSYLAVEVYKQKIPAPSLWQFLGFIFFAPAVPSGPISPYKLYLEGFSKPLLLKEIWPEAFSRLFSGVLKFVFFASLLETLTYPHFLFNGRRHGVFDLSVSSIACYLMVYCRFSGLIDMMIGAAALAGFPLKENFDAPLTARNLQDYWNRWHISLLDYIREVVFVPLLHFGVRKVGLQRMWILAPLCTFVVFILVGLWHGTGFNYLLFGLYHAAGLSLAYWYGLFFKKFWPTKNAAYKKSKIAYAISWFITFLYVSYGFILAANSWSDIRQIFQDIFLWTW